jgi:hypothetical protein
LAQSHAVVAGAVLNGVRESGSYYYRKERLYRGTGGDYRLPDESTSTGGSARVKPKSRRRRAG